MRVNGQDTIPIRTLSQNLVPVGSTFFLNTLNANTINIYAYDKDASYPLPIQYFTDKKPCGPQGGYINTFQKDGTAVLQAQNTSVCVPYFNKDNNQILQTQNSLVQVSFAYHSASDEFPTYCVSSLGVLGCLNTNEKHTHYVGFAKDYSMFTDFFEVQSTANALTLHLMLDATAPEDHDKLKQITYKDVSIAAYPLLQTVVPTLVAPKAPVLTAMPIQTHDSTLAITFEKASNSYSFPNLLGLNLYKKTPTVATDLPITGDAYTQERQTPEKTLRVFAKDTMTQLWIRLPNMFSDYGYLVRFNADNASGFPMILNMFSVNDNVCYTYAPIDRRSMFAKNYFVLPPVYPFDKGLQMAFFSQSFNNTPSVNDIKNLSIYPLPFAYITSIKLANDELAMPQETSLRLLNGTRRDIDAYTATVVGSGTLTLSQSFDPGWQAYTVSDTSFLSSTLPFFFGQKLSSHNLVNGWENGWSISASEPKTVVMIYTPQYLQTIGFFLLFGCLVVVGMQALLSRPIEAKNPPDTL